jgi:hypothetical protein
VELQENTDRQANEIREIVHEKLRILTKKEAIKKNQK